MRHAILVATLVSMFWVSPSSSATIGLYADTECSVCNLQIGAPSFVGTFYVAASNAANIPGHCLGFTAAAFRITGLPSGWIATVTPAQNSMGSSGDIFGAGGTISFSIADPIFSDCILLYTVSVIPVPPGSQAVLQVMPTQPLQWSEYDCPLIYTGDCPAWPFACAKGGTLFINHDQPCTVGVQSATWHIVKGLFR